MCNWNTSFHGVSIQCIDKLIMVKNDEALIKYLNKSGANAVSLAKEMKKQYNSVFNKEINIKEKSLAIEIIGHVDIECFASVIEKIPFASHKFKEISKELKSHTDVIDCGEKSVDSNRFVWDDLIPFEAIILNMF